MASSALVSSTCMELALEGERLCKSGDLKNGVKFFEEAIKVGTNDEKNLSAIYSQLGNAYYYMGDYNKALEYHKLDVELVGSVEDKSAEAKACGNLGNTYKMLDKFHEAAFYCLKHLEISRKLNDKSGEAKALYNLGNVYYTKGRRLIESSQQEPGCLSNEIKTCFLKAIEYYEKNLKVVTELNDLESMGRAYGNLGNTYYLLEDYKASVENHTKRLEIAKQTNDTLAERRAHVNLGNALLFLGNYNEAIKNYSATLEIAEGENQVTNYDYTKASGSRGSHPTVLNPSVIKNTYRRASLAAKSITGSPKQSQRRQTVSHEHRDQLIELISRAQGERMDEQRASLPDNRQSKEKPLPINNRPQKLTKPHDEFIESLLKYQSNRFDDQRAEFPNNKEGTDDFFNLILKFQSDRIDDQRSAPPPRNKNI